MTAGWSYPPLLRRVMERLFQGFAPALSPATGGPGRWPLAQLEIQLGPHLAVFGLEARVCLATRAPNSSKCVH